LKCPSSLLEEDSGYKEPTKQKSKRQKGAKDRCRKSPSSFLDTVPWSPSPVSVSQQGVSGCRPWANLPTVLLLDVAGRLHDAGDLVRFHAICQSWRDAVPFLLSTAAPALQSTFLPWLVLQPGGCIKQYPVFHYGRNVSSDAWSSSNGIAVREGSPLFTDKALVAGADGQAIGYSLEHRSSTPTASSRWHRSKCRRHRGMPTVTVGVTPSE
jgi:hypothetical protein